MKKHIVLIMSMIAFGTTLTVLLFCVGCTEQIEHVEPTPLVLDLPDPETKGTLTVYDDETGQVYFQYGGEIVIVNDGKNGQEIQIEVHLQSTGCTCEEGWTED